MTDGLGRRRVDGEPGAPPPRRRAWWTERRGRLAVGAALCLGLAACYLGRGRTRPGPPSSRDVPRVRVALVDGAPRVAVGGLEGLWRIEPSVGDAYVLDGPEALEAAPLPGARGLSLGERTLPEADAVTLRPLGQDPHGEPAFELDGRRYRGRLTLRRVDASLRAINSVGVEDYLAGVIGHEMPIRWHDAALRAQAIAARTYALTNLQPGQDHDLQADTRSQVYRGVMAEDERARRLVGETRGQVVAHGDDLVVTYFHSTCGGDTVPARWIFPWVERDSEPLSGVGGCVCQASRFHRWTKEVDLSAVGSYALVLELPLREVRVELWPRGGYVRRMVLVEASGAETEVSGWEARRLFGLRSYAFEPTLGDDGQALAFEGRGWGHGVGMCQYGAEGLASQGWTAEEILARYYPGTRVESLGY